MGRLFFMALVNLGAYAVLRRLWPSLGQGWRRGLFAGLAVASLAAWGLPLALGLGAHGTLPGIGVALKLFASAWLVAGMMTLGLGGPLVLLMRWRQRRALARAPAREGSQEAPGVDLERRSLLMGVGRAVPVVALGTSCSGVVQGSSGFVVQREEVRIKDLPAELEGFRIGQLTDVHVGPFVDVEYVQRAVAALDGEGVHLQVMTGDLIDDLTQLEGTISALGACQARHGMLAILGNHEHWRGLRPIRAAYAANAQGGGRVRLLVDESHVLEHEGARVRVVGVDYPMGRVPGMKQERMQRSAEQGFRGVEPGEFVLCLTHHPDFFPLAAERGAQLTLAGHTHGGQVAVWRVPVFWFAFKYMLGRYKHRGHHLYVSGGTGHWLPFRVGVPPEITVLTLRRA